MLSVRLRRRYPLSYLEMFKKALVILADYTCTLLRMAPYVRMAPWKAFVEQEMFRRFKVGIGCGPTANVKSRVCLVIELFIIISICSAGNSVPPSLIKTTARWQLLPREPDSLFREFSNCKTKTIASLSWHNLDVILPLRSGGKWSSRRSHNLLFLMVLHGPMPGRSAACCEL